MQPLVFLPDNAPFTEPQRAWLNGFVAGLLGMERLQGAPGAQTATLAPAAQVEEDFPWHDPTLAIDERMKLAAGRPLERRMMAAMGQLDCGQCGYLCKTYAEAIAGRADGDLGKCVPGGRITAKKLKELIALLPAAPAKTPGAVAPPQLVERGYSRAAPVPARLISSTLLTAPGSEREVRHVALDLGESGLRYDPGDSLGIWPHNNPDEVELLIAILRAKGSEAVTLPDGAVLSAREALGRECDLRAPSDALYALLARDAKDEADRSRLSKLAEDDSQAEGLGVHDVLDALLEFPSARPSIVEFVAGLGRMQPRMYSIACSQKRHPREVQLTVSVLRYEKNGRSYLGTGSGLLSEHLRAGRALSVFVQRAHGFRLPADLAAQVIMVGPGTGIAPFRAFLQERAAAGAAGRNWLFFGNHRREADFLYRAELEEFAVKRVLSRMDLAFSREQTSKMYVQHKMLEAAPELWRWLCNGAYLYVCGDAQRMAGDVDLALQQIAVGQGGMDGAAAKRFLVELAKAGRYQRDVY
jgi:sulfite reductase (NADPH) flavoprotein alpha-component